MKLLRQSGEHISVLDGKHLYADSIENFRADHGSGPALPEGIHERVYEPGKRHALSVENSVVRGGPMPWPEGDVVIAAVAKLASIKRTRDQKESEESVARRAAFEEEAAKAKAEAEAALKEQHDELNKKLVAAKQAVEDGVAAEAAKGKKMLEDAIAEQQRQAREGLKLMQELEAKAK